VIGGFVLDTDAIIDFATGRTFYTRARVQVAVERTIAVLIPSVPLACAYGAVGPALWSIVDGLLQAPVVVIDERVDSRAIGALLSKDPSLPLDAAQVAQAAAGRGWPVLTSRPDVLRAVEPLLTFYVLP
jgi:hypothetical protein